jgi:hypothetical protein
MGNRPEFRKAFQMGHPLGAHFEVLEVHTSEDSNTPCKADTPGHYLQGPDRNAIRVNLLYDYILKRKGFRRLGTPPNNPY